MVRVRLLRRLLNMLPEFQTHSNNHVRRENTYFRTITLKPNTVVSKGMTNMTDPWRLVLYQETVEYSA